MPTEVSMSGGAPWGFRLSGGGTQALTVSRVSTNLKKKQFEILFLENK